jgi:hypothetical protein
MISKLWGKLLGVILISTLGADVGRGQNPLPTADLNGNYPRNTHLGWLVVDRTPNGLGCRWSEQMPTNWYDPTARLPRLNIGEWEVVRRFGFGSRLRANPEPAGFTFLYDLDGRPWLKVNIGSDNRICLVRANANFILPAP